MATKPLDAALAEFAALARDTYERDVRAAHETFTRRMQWLVQASGAPPHARLVGAADGGIVAEWDDVSEDDDGA